MTESNKIHVVANGASFEVPSEQSLDRFLVDRGFAPELVVVEHNLKAVSPSERSAIRLRDGDKLEVVRIVAGG